MEKVTWTSPASVMLIQMVGGGFCSSVARQVLETGFGSFKNDFWWGNENLHALTNGVRYELWVDLKYKEKSGYAH